MSYTARQFSQESYNENDQYAKTKITKYLIDRGHKIIQNEENYNLNKLLVNFSFCSFSGNNYQK